MIEISRIGLDLAKSKFQVHAVDVKERVIVQRQLRRAQLLDWFAKQPPCLIGLEACGTAHYWGRELARLGHEVRLIPPAYVKPYVRRNKNDAADAAAICEAVSRPSMRFVPIKSADQQAAAALHKTRALLIKQRTATMNSLRGQMAEFGIVAPQGARGLSELLTILTDPADRRLPELLRPALSGFASVLRTLETEIEKLEKQIIAWGRSNPTSRHLSTICGFGPILSTAMAAIVTDPKVFDSSRHFAASLGIVPRQDGTGGKARLGPISKRGDRYLRRLLVNGAMAVLQTKRARQDPWIARLLATKPRMRVAVALANKMARIAWAVMMRQQDYRPHEVAA